MKKQASVNHVEQRHNCVAQCHCAKFAIAAPLIGLCLAACDSNTSTGTAQDTGSGADNTSTVLADADIEIAPPITADTNLDNLEAIPGATTVTSGDPNATVGGGEDRVGLIIDSTQRCAVVNDSIELVIKRELLEGETPDENGELPNISGFVEFTQVFGDSLEIISRSDESAVFAMSQQDIVGLTSNIENGSVTAFLAGYDASAPADFILRKPAANGCLYAFKSADYCVAGRSTVGPIAFSRNGLSMSAIGCDLENPDSLSVIELPAAE